ncbi:MAG: type II toxin-antitoxin system Phd/YefM family antitoxin [Nitrospinae bacterium]|nr:type II toxin-antitoxin system Phd/YefM family antitoxin [Nitrospinota bacterium]
MKKLNVHEAKTHLSRYLEMVEKGETILLCRRNVPVAEIHPVAPTRKKPRPIGLAKGKFKMSADFDKALPKALIKLFTGGKP